jgi:4-amino-4-deoxy-L-arabinose transferase-like glycosyltransferase
MKNSDNDWFKASTAILLGLLCFLTVFYRLDKAPLTIWDEGRTAVNAVEMLQGHSVFVPYYNGSPDNWSLKPALLIWLQTISMLVFGFSAWAVRLPSALSAAAICLAYFFFFKKLNLRWTIPLLAAAVLLTSQGFIREHTARFGDYDALLSFTLFSFFCCWFLYLQKQQRKFIYWSVFFFVLAILSKGSAALPILPGILIFTIVSGGFKTIRNDRKAFLLSVLAGILVIGFIYGIRDHYSPGYLSQALQGELISAPFSNVQGHEGPFGYYIDYLWTEGFSRYMIFFLLAVACNLIFFSRNTLIYRLTLYTLCGTLSYLLIISFMQTKLPWYDAPLYPMLALITGLALANTFEYLFGNKKPLFRYLLFIVIFGLLFIAPARQIMANNSKMESNSWVMQDYGPFMEKIKRDKPDLKHYTIAHFDIETQLLFYQEALNRQGYTIETTKNIDSLKTGEQVCTCEGYIADSIETRYRVIALDTFKQCRLYRIEGRK